MSEPTPRFRSVGSGTNLERVLRELRRVIVTGELEPGDQLPAEPDLAAQLEVSRSVLREALKALQVAGYLEVRRGYGGGTFVASPTEPEEFAKLRGPEMPDAMHLSSEQIREVRLAVEPYAARLAAEAPLSDAPILFEHVEEIGRDAVPPARVLSAIAGFHMAVTELTDNPVFVSVLQSIRPGLNRLLNTRVRDETWCDQCRLSHEQVAKEIEAGRPARSEAAMRDDILAEV